ncbi:hypothetical protein J6590_096737, partial [Homalodisca vitripennis]
KRNFKPDDLVFRRNYAFSNKVDGHHAGLGQKFIGPLRLQTSDFESGRKAFHSVCNMDSEEEDGEYDV